MKDEKTIQIIDQRHLPHQFVIEDLRNVDDVARAIKEMHVRGAGLIGATAGFGMYLAAILFFRKEKYTVPKRNYNTDDFDEYMKKAGEKLKATRPTAVNLAFAVDRQIQEISKGNSVEEKIQIAKKTAQQIADEDVEFCRRIGEHGLKIGAPIVKCGRLGHRKPLFPKTNKL